MRIVYTVYSANIAGGEMVCLQIMRATREAGHSICLIVPEEGVITQVAAVEGFEFHVLPMQRSFQWYSAVKFARFLRHWHADLVHTHDVLPGMVLARLAGLFAGVPVICHVHLYHTFNRRPVIRSLQLMLDNLTARFSVPLIAVSCDTRRSLLDEGIPAEKIHVIPNGVKLNATVEAPTREEINARFQISPSAKLIGCVARLSPIKGQRDLLLAVPEIDKVLPNAEFLFIGADVEAGGRYLAELEMLAAQLNITHRVHFVGFQPDAARLAGGFDVFVLPSYKEAMPMSILEAMVAERPIVATTVNGIPEVVLEGRTGSLVAPGQPQALARAILDILCDPAKAADMGRAGRRHIESDFDFDTQVEQIFGLYRLATAHG